MSLISTFIANYQQEIDQWNHLKDHAIGICRNGLKEIDVMGNATGRVKATESLTKKLQVRNGLKPYLDEQAIMADQLDFVGLRIALYFPHQKQDVIAMLKEKFKYESLRPFDRDWKPDEPGIYQNLFGQYVADHLWVSLHGEDRSWAGEKSDQRFEVQLRSVLMDAWAGISHELEYKALSGEPTGTELKLLDALKGHVEVGELMLEQLHRVHKRRLDTENEPILSPREVNEIILDSVPADQISQANMGDLDLLLLFLRATRTDTPHDFRDLLAKHGVRKSLLTGLARFQIHFYPVPTTVTFYLLEKLLSDLSKQEDQWHSVVAAVRKSQNRAWFDSRYWQPLLWLSRELLKFQKVAAEGLTASQVRKYVHIWGAEHWVRSQTPITLNDDCVIDCMSRTKNDSAPGLEFTAELCILGFGPTAPEYLEERDESDEDDDRFEILASAMQLSYSANSKAWTQAIYDYGTSLLGYSTDCTYIFFHSTDIVLWLMTLGKTQLLTMLLKVWPLGNQAQDCENSVLDKLCELAERTRNKEMMQLLKGEIAGFHMLHIELLQGFQGDPRYGQFS